MATSQRDVRNRIGSVKNIQKITRAMEMVAAARLRRAEQRIEALRPYASALRRMTRQAAEAAGDVPRLPILVERDPVKRVGLVVVAGDRGLAGAFNSNVVRAGVRAGREHGADGADAVYFASGKRAVSSLGFRGVEVAGSFTGFTDRPSYADARRIADDLVTGYADLSLDRVEIIYNGYVSPLTQRVTRETLLPISEATILSEQTAEAAKAPTGPRALVDYEPDAEEILRVLLPDYVEISIYRALLESTASEHGARMTAMRSASENAGELIEDLALEMNRARQAEITQEIMEVVAGAESLV
jgi:F-type H+-transporting ATPase subunit gamma